MNSKSQLQMPSFVGNPSNSPALCFPANKTTKIERQQTTLCGCQKAPKSRCISAIGKQKNEVKYFALFIFLSFILMLKTNRIYLNK